MFQKLFFCITLLMTGLCFADNDEKSLLTLEYEFVDYINHNGITHTLFTLKLPCKVNPTKGVLVVRTMDGHFADHYVEIRSDGTLWQKDKPFYAAFNGGYAEKFELLLASIDGKKTNPLASCVIVPFPKFAKDESGRKVELHSVDPDGTLFTIEGTGFKSKEKISVTSRSCHEKMNFGLETDDKGNFKMNVSPAVVGKKEGPFQLVFFDESKVGFSINHFWGKIAFTTIDKYSKLREKCTLPPELPGAVMPLLFNLLLVIGVGVALITASFNVGLLSMQDHLS